MVSEHEFSARETPRPRAFPTPSSGGRERSAPKAIKVTPAAHPKKRPPTTASPTTESVETKSRAGLNESNL
jgi:hypothetical protein